MKLRMGSQEPDFAVRVVSIDYYMTKPTLGWDECYSQLNGRAVERVPVIRVFGSTPSGQKACAHIHGAFPYLYVPLETPPETQTEVRSLMTRMAECIDAAPVATDQQGAPMHRQRVFAVHLVKACKFYGFHATEQLFAKFLLYNPTDVTRVATMLQSGKVLGQPHQPHESHIPFLLQFKIDFNLFGMGHLRLSELCFRPPVPVAGTSRRVGWNQTESVVHHEVSPSGEDLLQSQASRVDKQWWQAETIPQRWLPHRHDARSMSRQSCCELEIDTHVESILNRKKLVRSRLEDAGPQEQLVESLIPMWIEEKQRSGGSLPILPESPERKPGPLCQTVEDVRAQFQAIADAQQAAGKSFCTPAPSTAKTPELPPTPQSKVLADTPAANLATSLFPGTSQEFERAGSAHGPAMPVNDNLASWSEEQQETMWGDCGVPEHDQQVLEAEMHELMEWMSGVEGTHAEAVDPLLALADQVDGLGTPMSQQQILEHARAQYMSQKRREVDDIIEVSRQEDQEPSPVSHRQMRMVLEGDSAAASTFKTPGPFDARFRTAAFASSARQGLSQEFEQAAVPSQRQTTPAEQAAMLIEENGAEPQQRQQAPVSEHPGPDFQEVPAHPTETIPQLDGAGEAPDVPIHHLRCSRSPSEGPHSISCSANFQLQPPLAEPASTVSLAKPSANLKQAAPDCQSGANMRDHLASIPQVDGADGAKKKSSTPNKGWRSRTGVSPAKLAADQRGKYGPLPLRLSQPSPPQSPSAGAAGQTGQEASLSEQPRPGSPQSQGNQPRQEAIFESEHRRVFSQVTSPPVQSGPLQAAIDGSKAGQGGDGATQKRSLADVRRTHALATAARSFLHSPDSADRNSSELADDVPCALDQKLPCSLPSHAVAHGAAAMPAQKRSSSEVRRAHALATAARKFLRSSSSEGEDCEDGDQVAESSSIAQARQTGAMPLVAACQQPGTSSATLQQESGSSSGRDGGDNQPAKLRSGARDDQIVAAGDLGQIEAACVILDSQSPSRAEQLEQPQQLPHPVVRSPCLPLLKQVTDGRRRAEAAMHATGGLDPPPGDLQTVNTEMGAFEEGRAGHKTEYGPVISAGDRRKFSQSSGGGADCSHIMKLRTRPPTQAELDASMAANGLLPVIAPVPHYGNPSDLPSRPPVFSGLEYKLPTAAVSELPQFKDGGSSTGAMERLKALQPRQPAQGTGWRLVRACRPPHPAAVKKWLAELKAGQQKRLSDAPHFSMDPNTGQLLPEAASRGEAGALTDSDLLGTPLFSLRPPEGHIPRKFQKSRLSVMSQAGPSSQPDSGMKVAAQEGSFCTPAPNSNTENAEAEVVRPSSPKYDERTFFYTTPQFQLPRKTRSSVSPIQRGGKELPRQPQTFSGKRKAEKGLFETSPFAKSAKVSQITGPSPQRGAQTPLSQAGFTLRVAGKGQQLTLLSIEIHADSRGKLLPDPRYDALRCIVMAVMDDDEIVSDANSAVRILLIDGRAAAPSSGDGLSGIQIESFSDERKLLEGFILALRALDPDIILGWEIQQWSLGFITDRAALFDIPLLRAISRTPETASVKEFLNDEYGQLHASGLHSTGRVILNMWRVLRSEVKLNIYTFESCVAAILQLRTPHLPPWQLTQWFNEGPGARNNRWRSLKYLLRRARLNLAMLEQLDLIGRTGELARAFGIDFFSVLTRGSQYRVESLLVRLAHSQNYLMLSPSREQVGKQPAMECIPLVMEPESKMYSDPVVVLDFQSLYPSQIIAYNLCFSTCLGRPHHARDPLDPHPLGASSYALPAGTLTGRLKPANLTVSPNGIAWAPCNAKAGVVPRLLNEILNTRIMIKAAMKRHPASAKVLQRVLNARQFGLKLIANVTYGYAAAGFSGRMPMAELADAIVQSGRQTLENAIEMVEGDPDWKAKVVYGDTDSLFVLLKGRSRKEAFRIGAEIAARATAANPPPVTLKMEKVYHPCVLASKKRYVGHMYESPMQEVATFDAKGIETVRRDSCPVVAKMLERSLRILFTTHDISQVKTYVLRQWTKILTGRVSLADFVFAQEVRLGTYSENRPGPPAAIVAAKAMAQDPRAEPRFSERVPYIVVYGAPDARLMDMVVPPQELVEAAGRLRLNAQYYILKQIVPALERALNLVGADPASWFREMPRPQRLLPQKRPPAATLGGRTIDQYYLSRHCAVCDALTRAVEPLCEICQKSPQTAAGVLYARCSQIRSRSSELQRICMQCGGGGNGVVCDSLDCGVYFERRKTAHELASTSALAEMSLRQLEI